MEKRKNSASSLKTLQQCVFKYYSRYEAKTTKFVGTEQDALPFGTAVHAGLEALFQLHVQRYGTGVRLSADDYEAIRKVYMESISLGGLDKLSIIEEGWNMLKARMDNFDYTEKVISTEQFFDLETEAGTMFLGHIDKVVELDDDSLAIIDYKTSKTALTQQEADDDVQLSMYDLAASILFPQYKTVVLVLDYVRLGNIVVSHRTPSQRAAFVEWLDLQDRRIMGISEKDAKPSLHQFCGWCEYRQACPAFREAVTVFDADSYLMSEFNDEEAVTKWEQLKLVKKAVEAADRDLKMQIDEALSLKASGEMHGSGDTRLYRAQTARVSYSPAAIKEALPDEDFVKVVTIHKGSLDKLLLKKPELADKVHGSADVSYTAASIRTASKKSSKYGG